MVDKLKIRDARTSVFSGNTITSIYSLFFCTICKFEKSFFCFQPAWMPPVFPLLNNFVERSL